jgi:hypothetical protein
MNAVRVGLRLSFEFGIARLLLTLEGRAKAVKGRHGTTH